MTPKKRKKKPKRSNWMTAPQRVAREWIGLHFPLPAQVGDCDDPELLVWLELPGPVAIGQTVQSARELDVAASFTDTTKQPLVGFQRRPKRVRVPTEEMARSLRTLGSDLEIVVAPVPEADEFREGIIERLSGGDYLSSGVEPESVAALFTAAAAFHAARPWRFADDTIALRLDAPDLEIEDAVVSIIGSGGELEGFSIYESPEAFEHFLDAACSDDPAERADAFIGYSLVLTLDPIEELPEAAARQIDVHGWRLTDGKAPWVSVHEDDAITPPAPEEIDLAASVAAALASFALRHGRDLDASEEGSLSGRYEREGGTTVFLSGPYFFDVGPEDDELDVFGSEPEGPLAALHELDNDLTLRIHGFATQHHLAAAKKIARTFGDPGRSLVLLMPWMAYEARVGPASIVDLFLSAHADDLDALELDWIHAQEKTALSIWEVRSVRPGTEIDVVDLLTGERRTVTEVSASESLVARDAVLARVVDFDGECMFVGMHPYHLPPAHTAAVVAKTKRKLRRKTAVSVDHLRGANLGPWLIRYWEAEVSRFHDQCATVPKLANRDGDPILWTIDHFAFDAHRGNDVEAWLKAQPDVHPPEPEETDRTYRFTSDAASPTGATLLATAYVGDGKLRIECNSVQRSDALRRRVDTDLGSTVTHRLREHSDPLSSAHPPPSSTSNVAIPNAAELIRDFKNKHYESWCDEALPALDGDTPRAASRTAAGRERVAVLLADLENHEARLPPAERYDVDRLRAILKISG